MKKNQKLILILITAIIVGYVVFTYLPLGLQKYKSEGNNITFNIPSFSIFEEECCMTSANFKSIRNTYSIKKEIEKELENYEKLNCDNKTYYYDRKQDFTIVEYNVENGFIFNKFNITFSKGEFCDSEKEPNYVFEGNYNFQNAEKDGYVVYSHIPPVINFDKVTEFYDNSKNNISGYVTIIYYTVEGDPIIYQYHYIDGIYTVFHDSTRDKFSSEEDRIVKKYEIKDIEIAETDTKGIMMLQEKVFSISDEIIEKLAKATKINIHNNRTDDNEIIKTITNQNGIREITNIISNANKSTDKFVTSEGSNWSIVMYDVEDKIISTIWIWESGYIGLNYGKEYTLGIEDRKSLIKIIEN